MAPRAAGIDDELRALYLGPFAEFTTARNALAKRLKKEGSPREAEVKELKKPSLSAWAVDQLFAQEARAMAAFVGAGERARAAQRKAAAGGDPKALRDLLATIRGEVARLTGRGVELLAETEKAPGEAIVDRLRTNLEALALDPAAAEVAARGWLDADLDPPGFEVMAALQVAASRGAPLRGPGSPAAATTTGRPRAAAPAPARTSVGDDTKSSTQRAAKPLATVHRFDDARNAAAARRERAERDRAERRAHRERLASELARAEREARERRTAAERAEVDAADAERRAGEARTRAQKAVELAKAAEAAVAQARQALAEFE